MSLSVETMEDCAVAQGAADNVWNEMTVFANEHNTVDTFTSNIEVIEDEFCIKYFADNEWAKTKSGKWKKTYTDPKTGEKVYIIPNAWTTARSVVTKALQAEINPYGRGQTAVAKEAREKLNAVKLELGSYTKIQLVLEKLTKVMAEETKHFSSYEKESLRESFHSYIKYLGE